MSANLKEGETKKTPIGLTNHSYFNLAGHDHPNGILGHQLEIKAQSYTLTDSDSIPTKEIANLSDVPSMDFRQSKKLEDAIRSLALAQGYSDEEAADTLKKKGKGGPTSESPLGFDHNYCLDGEGLRVVAILEDADSGRKLTLSTTSPGVQLYTANYIDKVQGKGEYGQWQGLCLETQTYPDSIGD